MSLDGTSVDGTSHDGTSHDGTSPGGASRDGGSPNGHPSISVVGCVQVDLVLTPVVELPPSGGTLLIDDMGMRLGGAGANAALAFAEIGVHPRLFGCVGDDHLGRWMIQQLGQLGLGSELVVLAGERSGLTVACEGPDRDRTFLTYLGVNADWTTAMIPATAYEADQFLFCDYFVAPALQGSAAREILATAQAKGATTFFDTAWDPHGWSADTRAEVLGLLAEVDVFLPNEAEAFALSGVSDSAAEAGRILQAASGRWVVIKLGARGCLAVGPGGAEFAIDAPSVAVVDTTGAGDSFNAGLAAALARGDDWPTALQSAILLASTMISRPSSARYSLPAS
jgi:sugar/nucleoside kinase (ribokinase family)